MQSGSPRGCELVAGFADVDAMSDQALNNILGSAALDDECYGFMPAAGHSWGHKTVLLQPSL